MGMSAPLRVLDWLDSLLPASSALDVPAALGALMGPAKKAEKAVQKVVTTPPKR
jgi:hypothetical protein